jgi:hypothetical protein
MSSPRRLQRYRSGVLRRQLGQLRSHRVCDQPAGTKQFYISGSNAVTWDALDFGIKTSSADPLVAAAALNDQLWLLGTKKGEVWYFSGDVNFPFQQLPNVVIEHGVAATYSIGQSDKFLFWLTADKDGKPWIARGASDYSVRRFRPSPSTMKSASTPNGPMRSATATRCSATPSIRSTFHLPTSRGFTISATTNGMNIRPSISTACIIGLNGFLSAYAYNTNVMIDWKTGDLYSFDPDTFTDNTMPVVCIRGFPHLGANGNEVSYPGFMADMDVGEVPNMLLDPIWM